MIKNILKSMLFISISLFSSTITNACCNPNQTIEFTGDQVVAPAELGPIKLCRDKKGFHVVSENGIIDVENCNCDSILLEMSDDQLKNFVKKSKPKIVIVPSERFNQIASSVPNHVIDITNDEKDNLLSKPFSKGYISVNQSCDGKLRLKAKIIGIEDVRRIMIMIVAMAVGAVLGAFVGSAVFGTLEIVGTDLSIAQGAASGMLILWFQIAAKTIGIEMAIPVLKIFLSQNLIDSFAGPDIFHKLFDKPIKMQLHSLLNMALVGCLFGGAAGGVVMNAILNKILDKKHTSQPFSVILSEPIPDPVNEPTSDQNFDDDSQFLAAIVAEAIAIKSKKSKIVQAIVLPTSEICYRQNIPNDD